MHVMSLIVNRQGQIIHKIHPPTTALDSKRTLGKHCNIMAVFWKMVFTLTLSIRLGKVSNPVGVSPFFDALVPQGRPVRSD